VASVGNNNSSNIRYPGSYHRSFSVAATDQTNHKTTFSNYGKERVRVTAPGVQIYSTHYLGGYAYGDGTSFSTPLVAGISALVWARNPGWKYDNVVSQIESTAVNLSYCDLVHGPNNLGKGIVDAYHAAGGSARPESELEPFACL
jgi:subtilisin family serine protease